jgi:ABC-type Fe3+ transport system permease subunit
MDKKMITGVLMTIMGFVVSLVCFIYVLIAEETTYGGIGLFNIFIETGTLIPFIVSAVVMCIGLVLCFMEAYQERR